MGSQGKAISWNADELNQTTKIITTDALIHETLAGKNAVETTMER